LLAASVRDSLIAHPGLAGSDHPLMPDHDIVRSSLRLMQRWTPDAIRISAQKFVPAWMPNSDADRTASIERSATLGRLGSLEVRLAVTRKDIKRAQRLRYKVFYKNGGAIADARTMLARRDKDPFDKICDHLLVLEHNGRPQGGSGGALARKPPVVGTYRLLAQHAADRHGGFYSEGEFDLAPLIDRHRQLRFLELGHSCVLPPYRNKRTVELLWHGVWSYVRRNRFDVMIGCASLEGTDADRLALPLSFLYHYAAAPAEWRAAAHGTRRIDMKRMPKDSINPRAALHDLPPLVKGYLRLGAFVGDGAVIDYQFGTTDVLVILPVGAINTRYIQHFGADAERHAA
jgi:putative hemolysin